MISVTVLSVSYSAMSVWFGPAVEGDNFEVSYIRPTMNQKPSQFSDVIQSRFNCRPTDFPMSSIAKWR